ncbi:MAG: aminotransferase class V-fold PLP-dependent enzyme [Gaiellaceae bacterium MAG52_C11]|nr:aminotransferase class V-fold PLP-dependent enzyme [Candidatus Gaiellasilicea maunaloa]
MAHDELLRLTADYAAQYVGSLPERPVAAPATIEELRQSLAGPLPEEPTDALQVVAELIAAAEPGVVATGSGRYFGFVIGGALPAALAADWLTSTWDQNAGLVVGGPSAAVVEEVCLDWLVELLGLPSGVSAGFVTGCQMAHVTALAAARHHQLERAGWDLARGGLQGAPRIHVVVGAERHVTVDRAFRFLGLGSDQIEIVEADEQGRMRPDALRAALAGASGPIIVCAQAGNVNTGSFDPLEEIADAVEAAGAWLHVDGAFGLWAAASPQLRHLVAGCGRADSWATDGHKWLNVPYDSGIAFCAHPESHRSAMSVRAAYLEQSEPDAARDQMDWSPEFSRRARGFPIYAAIRSLGRSGIAAMVEGSCERARELASILGAADGVEILNDVVLNQVLLRFGDADAVTQDAVRRVQDDGTCWLSGTTWQGRAAMRISVSNWQTSPADVERSAAAILTAASVPVS